MKITLALLLALVSTSAFTQAQNQAQAAQAPHAEICLGELEVVQLGETRIEPARLVINQPEQTFEYAGPHSSIFLGKTFTRPFHIEGEWMTANLSVAGHGGETNLFRFRFNANGALPAKLEFQYEGTYLTASGVLTCK